MYKFSITCLSYENQSFRFRLEFSISDLTELKTSNMTFHFYNACIVRGIPMATLRVSITDFEKGYRSHIVGEKIAISYENIFILLESAINAHFGGQYV